MGGVTGEHLFLRLEAAERNERGTNEERGRNYVCTASGDRTSRRVRDSLSWLECVGGVFHNGDGFVAGGSAEIDPAGLALQEELRRMTLILSNSEVSRDLQESWIILYS